MNKIYRTVWNEAAQTWVAVSELAKSTGKSSRNLVQSSDKPTFGVFHATLSVLTVIIGLAVSGQVQAANGIFINDGSDAECTATFDGRGMSGIYAIKPGNVEGWDPTKPKPAANDFFVNAAGNPCRSVQDGSYAPTGAEKHDTQTNRTLFYTDTWNRHVNNNGAKNLTLGGRLDVNSGIIGLGDRGTNGQNATNSIRIGTGATLYEVNKKSNAIAIGVDTISRGSSSTAIGAEAIATSTDALAIGTRAKALANNAVALGSDVTAGGEESLAVGNNVKATHKGATAIGNNSEAKATGAQAFGQSSVANKENAVAIGRFAQALAERAAAFGISNKAEGTSSLSVGDQTVAKGDYTVAMGYKAQTEQQNSVAIGTQAHVVTKDSIAIGLKAKVSAGEGTAVAIGANALASNKSALALGNQAKASGSDSAAFGSVAMANGASSLAMGPNAQALRENTTAVGNTSKADGERATALGQGTQALSRDDTAVGAGATTRAGAGWATAVGIGAKGHGVATTALGYLAEATAERAVAVGPESKASALKAIAIGNKAEATAESAISIGTENKVSGKNSAAIGDPNYVSGTETYVYGNNNGTQAAPISATHSTIVGHRNKVSGAVTTDVHIHGNDNNVGRMHSMVLGTGNKTESTLAAGRTSEEGAIAIGEKNTVKADNGIAIGKNNEVSGIGGIALGLASKASNRDTIAIGNKAQAGEAGENGTAIGSYTSAGAWSTAVGTRSRAGGGQSASFGTAAYAKEQRALALGTYSYAGSSASTALGYETIVADNAHSASALGAGSVVSGAYSGAWGSSVNLNPTLMTGTGSSVRSYVGGANSYAIGNKNIIGTNSSDTFILGNNVKLGATSATLNSTNPVGTGNDISTRRENVVYSGLANISGMVALGSDTSVSVSDGVALGKGSAATTDKGIVGANPLNAAANTTTATWKSTKGAVAVGNDLTDTRQITGLAAGTQDTDAVNVAQLNVTNKVLKQSLTDLDTLLGGNADVKNDGVDAGKITMTDIGGTGKNNIHEAIEVANAGWELQKDGTRVGNGNIKSNDKVNFEVGAGITIDASASGDTFKLTFKVKSAALTSSTNGVAAVPANTPSDALATASSVKDAINSAGFTLKASQGTGGELVSNSDSFIKTGNTITAIADKNIKLTQANGELRIATKDNVEFTSVKTGESTLNNDGLTITGGPGVTKSNGIDAGNKVISNVASGGDVTTNAANIGDVQKAAKAAKTEVKAGKNVTSVVKTQGGDNQDIYTINVDGAKVTTANAAAITVTPSNKDADGITTYEVDLGANTKASLLKADSALQNVTTTNPNLTVTKTGDTATIDFKNDPTFTKTTVGNVVIDSATNKITGVENGTVAANSKDVVNGGQLHETNTNVTNLTNKVDQGLNFAGNTGNFNRTLGSTVNVKGSAALTEVNSSTDNVTTVAKNGDTIEVRLANAPSFTGKVSAKGFDAGGEKVTNVKTGEQDQDAVNVKQLKDEIDKVNVAAGNSGWEILGNGDKKDDVRNKDKVDFINGSNTTVTVQHNPATNTTTVSYAVNGKDLTIANGKVDIPSNATDIATAKSVAEAINAANFTLTSSNESVSTNVRDQINAGDTVTIDAGKNLTASQNGGTVTLKTKDNVEFTSVKAGDSTLNNDGLTIAGGPSVTKSSGINAGNKAITNVASGGNVTTNAANIGDVKAVRTEIAKGSNVSVTKAEDPNTGKLTYTVNADGTKVESATGSPVKVTASTKDSATNITTYTVDLEQDAKDSLAKAKTAVQDVQLAAGEKNLTLTKNNNVVELGLTKTPTFDKVTAGTGATTKVVLSDSGVDVGGNIYISDAGLNANDKVIANVTAGKTDKDAVNVSQLKPLATALGTTVAADGTVAAPSLVVTKADGSKYTGAPTVQGALDNIGTEIKKPITFVGNTGNFDRTLGQTATVKGTLADSAAASSANIRTEANNGTIEIKFADAPTFEGKVTAKGGFDANNQIIANVKDGVAGTDAVNVQQLTKAIKDVNDAAGNSGWEIQGNGTKADNNNVRNNDKVNFANSDTTTAVVTSDDDITTTVKYNVNTSALTTGADGKVTAATPNNAFATAGDVANAINSASFALTSSNNGTSTGVTEQIKAGDRVTIDAGKNLEVAQVAGKVTVVTKDNVEFTSVKAGNSTLNNDGLTITGGPSVKSSGIDAGSKVIANVASGAGNDTNAANIGDVKAARTEVAAGTNVSVTKAEDPNTGKLTYTVNAEGAKVESADTSTVTVVGTKDSATNITTYKVDLTQTAKDSLANVATNSSNITALQNQTFKLQANNDTASAVKASDTVKFINGDNINITRNGNDITIATAKDVAFDKVTAGSGANQVVLNNNGVEVGGNVYISNGGLNANNKTITNVAPAALNATSLDAVNGSQLHATNVALQALSVDVAAAQIEVHAGNNVSVDHTKGSKGQNVYTVHAEKTTVSGSGAISVTAGPRSVTGVTDYAVDLAQSTKDDIAAGVAAKNAVDNKGLTFTADLHATNVKKLGDTVAVNGDSKNITTTATPDGIIVALNNSISVANVSADAVNIKGNGPSMNQNGLQMANTQITGMASGLPIDPISGKPMTTVQIEQGIIDGTIDPAVLQNAVNISDLAAQSQNAAQVNNIIYGTDPDANPYVNGNGTITSAGRAALRTYNVDGKGTSERNGIFNAIKNMNEQGIKFFHTNDGVVKSVKDGHSEEDSNAEAPYSTAIGYQALVEKSATGGLAIGAGARAIKAESVALGAGSEAGEAHLAENTSESAYTYGGLNDANVAGKPTAKTAVLSVGKPGAERQVQNVAAGVISETSTDAVNGSQLYQTNKAVANNTRAINQLRGDVHKMDNRLRAGVAGAYAAASLGQVYIPGKTQVSLGSGHYRGESAVALGVSRVSDNGKVQVRLIGSTNTRGDTGAGASVSYLW